MNNKKSRDKQKISKSRTQFQQYLIEISFSDEFAMTLSDIGTLKNGRWDKNHAADDEFFHFTLSHMMFSMKRTKF